MQGPKFMPWMESITRSFEILFLDLVIAIVGGSFMAYGIQSENENIRIVLFGFGLFVIAGAASSAMIKSSHTVYLMPCIIQTIMYQTHPEEHRP